MKTHHLKIQKPYPRGFALIVTLTLMILLTVIAVGLLSLAGVSLRTSSSDDAASIARNNARLSLMLAIGDLQKQMGPDTRISITSDQIASSGSPDTPQAPEGQRHWTGVYQSWPAALPSASRPEPEFRQWLVSGNPDDTETRNYATTGATSSTDDSVEIVTSRTVDSGETVKVPKITQTTKNGAKNGFAWWVGDQGVKALIAPSKAESGAIGDVRADLQAIPASNIKSAKIGAATPFSNVEGTDEKFARVQSWASAALLARNGNGKPAEIGGLFHDFATQSRGLLTNVRAGGFRKDLSMELEKPSTTQPNPTSTALYTVGGETGINMQELWSYYNLPSTTNASGRGLNWSTSATFTTGGSMSSKTPCLVLSGSANDLSDCQNDDFFHYKQPVIINYQLVLSLQTRVVSGVNRLHIVTDPIITFWNPLDVPVVVPANMLFTIKYWQIPYNLRIKKGGSSFDCPIVSISKADSNFMSLEIGGLERMIFKPGEVLKVSQTGATLAKSAAGDIHRLAAKKGFLFGQGVAWEAATQDGAKIDLAGAESVVFESAIPNNLTAGKTAADGNIIAGGNDHTRHFSLTHHEYYLGKDRGTAADSLGIGGIYLDYDFGNKRVATNVTRQTNTPGTKPTADRYYANQRPATFPTLTDGRTVPSTGVKMPIMLLSFNVKTENGAKLSTRSLSRFNPKALQVDFYDLQEKEREMLPYEYSVELLNGWKSSNDSLEQNSSGQGYFGAAWNAMDGSNYVITHSVPREPIVSLAAFQHSFANGFNIQKPKYGYSTLNAREPLLPQISHAIGNSLACPVIDKDKTSGTLSGNRPLADHSYLANQALFDDWFLSGIAPQNSSTFAKTRVQKVIATEFFSGAETGRLPVNRYLPNTRGKDPAIVANSLFSGSRPIATATANVASYLQVDGLFNVNSTSVEAWKSLLGSRNGRKIVVRDANGKESIQTVNGDNTPVSGLFSPANAMASGSPSSLKDPAQWTGYRSLTEDEIDSLARGIVREVRKRGPFISLADFVNRRVGTNDDLARAGAIQNALDSQSVTVNQAYNTGSRASSGGNTFSFKDAERGPKSYGAPGVVKQADILTPIAPILSARSDSFIIRGYGEKTDATGKVVARAWCEAVVERGADFVDPADQAEQDYATINETNQNFGRQFKIVSFRWLNPSEA